MVTGYSRGHLIKFTDNQWVWSDTGVPIENERPCKRCGRMPTAEGYDACLGFIEGATSACCGHGRKKPYVIMENTQNVAG